VDTRSKIVTPEAAALAHGSPCLQRACPIDHRCMTRVAAARVVSVALQLWEETAH